MKSLKFQILKLSEWLEMGEFELQRFFSRISLLNNFFKWLKAYKLIWSLTIGQRKSVFSFIFERLVVRKLLNRKFFASIRNNVGVTKPIETLQHSWMTCDFNCVSKAELLNSDELHSWHEFLPLKLFGNDMTEQFLWFGNRNLFRNIKLFSSYEFLNRREWKHWIKFAERFCKNIGIYYNSKS